MFCLFKFSTLYFLTHLFRRFMHCCGGEFFDFPISQICNSTIKMLDFRWPRKCRIWKFRRRSRKQPLWQWPSRRRQRPGAPPNHLPTRRSLLDSSTPSTGDSSSDRAKANIRLARVLNSLNLRFLIAWHNDFSLIQRHKIAFSTAKVISVVNRLD